MATSVSVPNHVTPENVAEGVQTWFRSASRLDRISARLQLQVVLDAERDRQLQELP